MIFIAIGLIIVAAAAFIAEMFIPGFGVFGIGGIICLLAGVAITVMYTPYGFLAALIEVIVLAGLALAVLRYIRRKKGLETIILRDELVESGVQAASGALINERGVTVTPLKPFGVIDINGVRLEASSEGGLIAASVNVAVVSVKEGKVFVKPV